MAANIAEIFVLTGFGSPASVATVNADPTGATGSFSTVVTGGINGSLVTGLLIRAVTDTAAGTVLNIFHTSSSTHRNIGSVVIPGGTNPALAGVVPFEIQWTNPNGAFPLKSGDKIEAAQISGSTTFHIMPLGGDY